MFVVRYLVVAIVTIALAMLIGFGMGYSVWKTIGIALLLLFVEQVLILGFVIFSALTHPPEPQSQTAAKRRKPISQQS